MNELEDYILGQLLFYEQTRALLPRIKHQWFEQPLHREVIQRMSVAYRPQVQTLRWVQRQSIVW